MEKLTKTNRTPTSTSEELIENLIIATPIKPQHIAQASEVCSFKAVAGMDASAEPTGMYLRRALKERTLLA